MTQSILFEGDLYMYYGRVHRIIDLDKRFVVARPVCQDPQEAHVRLDKRAAHRFFNNRTFLDGKARYAITSPKIQRKSAVK